MSEIERLDHQVTDAGNPIKMDLKTRYVIKGIGKEQIISSKVQIFLDQQNRIEKVEDKWDGNLPESMFADVSRRLFLALAWEDDNGGVDDLGKGSGVRRIRGDSLIPTAVEALVVILRRSLPQGYRTTR